MKISKEKFRGYFFDSHCIARNCGLGLSHKRKSWRQHIAHFSAANSWETKSKTRKSGRKQLCSIWNLIIKKRRPRWFGHASRIDDGRLQFRNKSRIGRHYSAKVRKTEKEPDWHSKTRFKWYWHDLGESTEALWRQRLQGVDHVWANCVYTSPDEPRTNFYYVVFKYFKIVFYPSLLLTAPFQCPQLPGALKMHDVKMQDVKVTEWRTK